MVQIISREVWETEFHRMVGLLTCAYVRVFVLYQSVTKMHHSLLYPCGCGILPGGVFLIPLVQGSIPGPPVSTCPFLGS